MTRDHLEGRRRRFIRLKGYDYSQAGAYFVTICTQGRLCLFGDVMDTEMRLSDAGRMVESVWDSLPERFLNVALDAFVVMPNHIHAVLVILDTPARRGESCIRPTGESCIRPDGAMGEHEVRPYDLSRMDDPSGRGESCIRPAIAQMGMLGEHEVRPYNPSRLDGAAGEHEVRPYTSGPDGGRGEYQIRPEGAHMNMAGEHEVRPYDRPRGTLPGTLGRIIQAFKSITTHEYTLGVKRHGWTPFPGKLWQRNYYEHVIRSELELDKVRAYIADNPARWMLDRENPAVVQPDLSDGWLYQKGL